MIPADAFDLLDWPSVVGMFLAGVAFGALVVWQSPAFRTGVGSVLMTTFLGIMFAAALFTFLIAIRASEHTVFWGRTIGTAIQALLFALGMGLGLTFRKRFWA